jgi:hypothetical protein
VAAGFSAASSWRDIYRVTPLAIAVGKQDRPHIADAKPVRAGCRDGYDLPSFFVWVIAIPTMPGCLPDSPGSENSVRRQCCR